jgi:hypothetical protein
MMRAHPCGVAFGHRRIHGPTRLREVIYPELLIEVADTTQRRIIETNGLRDRPMSVLLHCHRGVNLHLTASGEKHKTHSCCRNAEQTREKAEHIRTLPAPYSAGVGEAWHPRVLR